MMRPACTCKARARAEVGFTLIEMLVTLAVLGFAALLIGQGIWMAGRVSARDAGTLRTLDEMSAARLIMRHNLSNLRAVTRSDSATPIVDARGDGASFTYFAPPLDAEEPAPLQRYRLLVTATGDLTLFTAGGLDDRFDFGIKSLDGWHPITLLSGVQSFAITYFGPSINGGQSQWQTRWEGRPQPPALIRVSLGFGKDDRRHWPDLVVRPHATVNTACRIDALNGRCEAFQ